MQCPVSTTLHCMKSELQRSVALDVESCACDIPRKGGYVGTSCHAMQSQHPGAPNGRQSVVPHTKNLSCKQFNSHTTECFLMVVGKYSTVHRMLLILYPKPTSISTALLSIIFDRAKEIQSCVQENTALCLVTAICVHRNCQSECLTSVFP